MTLTSSRRSSNYGRSRAARGLPRGHIRPRLYRLQRTASASAASSPNAGVCYVRYDLRLRLEEKKEGVSSLSVIIHGDDAHGCMRSRRNCRTLLCGLSAARSQVFHVNTSRLSSSGSLVDPDVLASLRQHGGGGLKVWAFRFRDRSLPSPLSPQNSAKLFLLAHRGIVRSLSGAPQSLAAATVCNASGLHPRRTQPSRSASRRPRHTLKNSREIQVGGGRLNDQSVEGRNACEA